LLYIKKILRSFECKIFFFTRFNDNIPDAMVYLDITIEQELKALATLEYDNDKKISKKWKNVKGGLVEFCGVKSMKY